MPGRKPRFHKNENNKNESPNPKLNFVEEDNPILNIAGVHTRR